MRMCHRLQMGVAFYVAPDKIDRVNQVLFNPPEIDDHSENKIRPQVSNGHG